MDIPVIDLASAALAPEAAAEALRATCVDTGFFYLVGHGISDDLFRRVFKAAEDFFALQR